MAHPSLNRRLNDFLAGLYILRSEEELSQWILAELPNLIPGDNGFVGLHDPARKDTVHLRLQHPFTVPNFLLAMAESGANKNHPIWSEDPQGPKQLKRPKVLSQMMGALAWREHPLYREFLKQDQVHDHLTLDIGRGVGLKVILGVIRSRRGFRDNEILALEVLGKHFEQAFCNARLFEVRSLRPSCDNSFHFEPAMDIGHFMAFVNTHGPQWSLLLGKDVKAYVPLLTHWFSLCRDDLFRGMLESKVPNFIMEGPIGRIQLRLTRNWGGIGFLLLVHVESFSRLNNYGLSPRETEVLHWVREAKTDPEIALILGIGLHTVKDHMKNIRRKLGVKTRTEAARKACELGNGNPTGIGDLINV